MVIYELGMKIQRISPLKGRHLLVYGLMMTISLSNLKVIMSCRRLKNVSSILSAGLVFQRLESGCDVKAAQKGHLYMTFQEVASFIGYMKTQTNRSVYIWGAGVYGDAVGQLLNQNGVPWAGYYDNYLVLDQGLNGKPVFSGKGLEDSVSSFYIVAVIKSETVRQQLQDCGVPENRMIWFEGINFWNDLRDSVVGEVDYSGAIKRFHNIHRGERCFIIGNGPSLIKEDLEKIQRAGVASFACNSIFNCFSQTCWRPDYYCAVDALFIRDEFKESGALQYILEHCRYMFARSDSYLFRYYNDSNIKNLAFCKIAVPASLSDVEFSEDCAEKVYTGYTVTYTMLQLAAYMGFSEIYLLGIDHHFSCELNDDGIVLKDGRVQDHLGALNDSYPVVAPVDKMTRAYEAAKRYADGHGIQIYNATRGGKLEVFPRVDFDSLF